MSPRRHAFNQLLLLKIVTPPNCDSLARSIWFTENDVSNLVKVLDGAASLPSLRSFHFSVLWDESDITDEFILDVFRGNPNPFPLLETFHMEVHSCVFGDVGVKDRGYLSFGDHFYSQFLSKTIYLRVFEISGMPKTKPGYFLNSYGKKETFTRGNKHDLKASFEETDLKIGVKFEEINEDCLQMIIDFCKRDFRLRKVRLLFDLTPNHFFAFPTKIAPTN